MAKSTARITHSEKSIVITYESVEAAAEVLEMLTSKLAGVAPPLGWVTLTVAAEFLQTTKVALAKKLTLLETECKLGRHTTWVLGQHYRRKPNSTLWQVNCKAISKLKN